MFFRKKDVLCGRSLLSRLFIQQRQLVVGLFSVILLTGALSGCGGFSIAPRPLINLSPLTPAAPVPLAQLKWCAGTHQSVTPPSFSVQLPPTLSADYCLETTSSFNFGSIQRFSLIYRHSYYNNSLQIDNSLYSYTLAAQGVTCKSTVQVSLQPSEPEMHTCTFIQGSSSITFTGPAPVEDLKVMIATLQHNIAFLPA